VHSIEIIVRRDSFIANDGREREREREREGRDRDKYIHTQISLIALSTPVLESDR